MRRIKNKDNRRCESNTQRLEELKRKINDKDYLDESAGRLADLLTDAILDTRQSVTSCMTPVETHKQGGHLKRSIIL